MKRIKNIIGNDWDEILEAEFAKSYFKEITDFLEESIKKTLYFLQKMKSLMLLDYPLMKILRFLFWAKILTIILARQMD